MCPTVCSKLVVQWKPCCCEAIFCGRIKFRPACSAMLVITNNAAPPIGATLKTNGRSSETERVRYDWRGHRYLALWYFHFRGSNIRRRLSELAVAFFSGDILSNQHRVAIAVEAISLFDCFSISFHRQIVTCQGRHQNQQRGTG